nr:MAG TPA: hypothetical protein [Caudoviricetes sp.]
MSHTTRSARKLPHTSTSEAGAVDGNGLTGEPVTPVVGTPTVPGSDHAGQSTTSGVDSFEEQRRAPDPLGCPPTFRTGSSGSR